MKDYNSVKIIKVGMISVLSNWKIAEVPAFFCAFDIQVNLLSTLPY